MRYFTLLTSALFCFLFLLHHQAHATHCFAQWGYRTPVTVSNATASTLTDYQVKITMNTSALVGAGKMRSDGFDIRFAAANCCTQLCHWIESGMNTSVTTIWVKLPSLPPGNTTIFLLYGNSTASQGANGNCTFEFFDDFSGTSLDATKWTTRGTPSLSTVTGGQLTFSGNGNWEYIRSNTTFSSRVRIHDRRQHNVTIPSATSAGFVLGYAGTDSRYTQRYNTTFSWMMTTYDTDVITGNAVFDNNYPGINFSTAMNNYELTGEIVSSLIVTDDYCNTTVSSCNLTPRNHTGTTGSAFYVGYSSFNNSTSIASDYIFVRKYTATSEPTASIGAEVTPPPRLLAFNPTDSTCIGSPLTLNAGPGFTSYAWNTGVTTQTTSASGSDTLWVTTTDIQGCVITDTVIVTGLALPANFITSSGMYDSIRVCPEIVPVLDAGAGYDAYSWTGGAITQTIGATTPSVYVATVLDTLGCTGSDTFAVSYHPSPSMIIWSGDSLALCTGDTVTVYSDPTFASWLWSTGDTIDSTNVSAPGWHYVDVTNTFGCAGTDSIFVFDAPLPVPGIVASGPLCAAGGLVTLDAGPGYTTYDWTTTDTTQTTNITSPGSYAVTVWSADGCAGTDTIVLNTVPNPVPVIAPAGPLTICPGTVTTLTATSGFVSYFWNTSETTPFTTADTSGTFIVTVTDTNGCTGSDSVDVLLYPAPMPVITQVVDTLFATPGFVTYQWYNGAVLIPGATGDSYMPPADGTYTVVVTDSNGCEGFSTAFVFILRNEGTLTAEGIRLYPNPGTSSFFITLPAGFQTVEVFTLHGQRVVSLVIQAPGTTEVSTGVLPAGIYVVRLSGADRTVAFKWVKE